MNKVLDYTLLKTFGCLCFVSTNTKDRTKFSPRAVLCVYLDYPSGYKGYKILDLESHSIAISRTLQEIRVFIALVDSVFLCFCYS